MVGGRREAEGGREGARSKDGSRGDATAGTDQDTEGVTWGVASSSEIRSFLDSCAHSSADDDKIPRLNHVKTPHAVKDLH